MHLKDFLCFKLYIKKSSLLRALLVLIIFINFGCKKDETQNSIYHGKLDSSILPFLFDSGSYWIYKDTSTNNIDSIVLYLIFKASFSQAPTTPSSPSQGDEEYFYMKYFSNYASYYFNEQLFSSVISRQLNRGGYIFISTKQIGSNVSNAEITDVIDSMTIENKTYHNVTKMKITGDYYIKGNHNFYYADSVGVIRKDSIVNDTIIQTWNLLRHSTIFYNYQ